MNRQDAISNYGIPLGASRRPAPKARVVPARGDTEQATRRDHGMETLTRFHELEDLPGMEPAS